MRRTTTIGILFTILFISTGCVSEERTPTGPEDTITTETTTGATQTVGTPTSTPICDEEYPDGVIHNCIIEERPPDVEIGNFHDIRHNIFITITDNDPNGVMSTTVSLNPGEEVIIEDVVASPGVYEITMTANNTHTVSDTWDFERRYNGDGDVYLKILVSEDGEIAYRSLVNE